MMLGLTRTGRLSRLAAKSGARAVSLAATSSITGDRSSRPQLRTSDRERPKLDSASEELMQKHKKSLEVDLNCLTNVVDHLEWRGYSSWDVIDKLSKLWHSDSASISRLNDRQLAVLFSAYGSLCDAVSRKQRMEKLVHAMEAVKKHGVHLGINARASYLASYMDVGGGVSATDELKAWVEDGLQPDGYACTQLARVNALEGNVKGVAEIIKHMRENGFVVGESTLTWMVYAICRQAHSSQAETAIKQFSALPGCSELRLRCAAASAAASRNDLPAAIQQLSLIPASEKIFSIENNKFVLSVLFEFLENGNDDALVQFRSFLTMVEDGSTLVDWHNNIGVVAASRRMRSEGNLEAALKTYSLVHPNARNRNAEENLRYALSGVLYGKDFELNHFMKLVELSHKIDVVRDVPVFLLSKLVESTPQRARLVYDEVKSRGWLSLALGNNADLKKKLVNKLTEGLNRLSAEDQINKLAEVAHVCFDSNGSSFGAHDFYSTVGRLSGNDISVPVAVLEKIAVPRVKREYATAIIQSILYSRDKDPLADDKMDKLLNSGAVTSISLGRVTGQVVRLLTMENKNPETDQRQIALAARLISLEFPEQTGSGQAFATHNAVQVFVPSSVNEQRMDLVVRKLEADPRVGFSHDELEAAKKVLEKQPNKLEILQRLKRRNQTMVRWNEASIDALEDELNFMLTKEGGTRKGVVEAIREVILRKASSESPVNFSRVTRHLQEVKEMKGVSRRLLSQASATLRVAFDQAVADRSLDEAALLWNLRSDSLSMDSTLTFISALYLTGRKEQAEEIIAAAHKSALSITGPILDRVGSNLVDFPQEKLDELAEHLGQKFNLSDRLKRRVSNKKKLQVLEQLIESGSMEKALQLATEESSELRAAFGHFQLARAAIRRGDVALMRDVYAYVSNYHSNVSACADMAYVMLEEGKVDQAHKMLAKPNFHITSAKLGFFIQMAVNAERPDVLHGLFTGLCGEERASTVDLNRLLQQLVRMYYFANDLDAIRRLEDDSKRASFPLEEKLRHTFRDLNNKDRKESAV